MSSQALPLSIKSKRTIFLLWLLIWASVSVRWILEFVEDKHPFTPMLVVILAVFGLLLIYENLRLGQGDAWTNIHLAVMTALVIAAMRLYFELDFFALLFLPLTGHAVLVLPAKQARGWIGVLVAATILGQVDQFGWPEALPFLLLYVTGVVFVALFSLNTLQAEAARAASDRLLEELRAANEKLQAFSGQAEALAVAEERNRLARDLHDSVAQSLYGLSLRSEAAIRHLGAGQYDRLEPFLRDFQEGTLQSLRETRLMIHELRPQILAEQGLAAALAHRLENVEKRSGLRVDFFAEPLPDLPERAEIALYRIAQEALNNVLKHAQARQVQVRLDRAGATGYRLLIADDGIGLTDSAETGGVGFESMRERAHQIGAEIAIRPHQPQGVAVEVTSSGGGA